jgi:hypothetical protein
MVSYQGMPWYTHAKAQPSHNVQTSRTLSAKHILLQPQHMPWWYRCSLGNAGETQLQHAYQQVVPPRAKTLELGQAPGEGVHTCVLAIMDTEHASKLCGGPPGGEGHPSQWLVEPQPHYPITCAIKHAPTSCCLWHVRCHLTLDIAAAMASPTEYLLPPLASLPVR